jgi:hypothetical protein
LSTVHFDECTNQMDKNEPEKSYASTSYHTLSIQDLLN